VTEVTVRLYTLWANEGGLASAIDDWAIQHPEGGDAS